MAKTKRRPGFADTMPLITPEKRARMEVAAADRLKRKGPVGCYSCCRQRGSRSDLWDNLCTVCHKVTRASRCCGYVTVTIHPEIRVPRVGSNRWKKFLEKYPQFVFSEHRKVNEEEGEE